MSKPPNSKPRIDEFNQNRYETIVKYKTSFYTFVLPVRLGIYYSFNLKVNKSKKNSI
jgi:hypothetical protein